MRILRSSVVLGLALAVLGSAQPGRAAGIIRISEWMYNGDEFVELTNFGDASVDFTGWSFDDNSRTPDSFSLSGFGIVAAGQSVILSEVPAATFRTNWGLALSVPVVGGNTHNLGRADEINIYDAADQLVDRLTFEDQTIGGPRTIDVSANIAFANLGQNLANLAVQSSVGDAYGSYASSTTPARPGNPGTYPVPEPGTAALFGAGLALLALRRRAWARRAAVLGVGTAGLGAALTLAPSPAAAFTLNDYALIGTFALPTVAAAEASAVAYNGDTDTLFVLGDEGDALVEVSKTTGAQISVMTLTGFADTEGITYVGGGQFVITEEREQDAYLLTYTAGGSVDRATLQTADLGPFVGNQGIEGISYDPLSGDFVTVKEKSPQEVNTVDITFGSPGSATVTSLFTPALGVLDLSDVSVLSAVPSIVGTLDEDNLLIYSQESAKLMEVSPGGTVLSSFDFALLSSTAEGVAIDLGGVIYVVDETPTVYVLAPIPEPSTAVLLGLGLAGLGRRARAESLS